jgi:hypothetical protein
MDTTRDQVVSQPRTPLREAFNGWFVTHEVAWELALAALAVLCQQIACRRCTPLAPMVLGLEQSQSAPRLKSRSIRLREG